MNEYTIYFVCSQLLSRECAPDIEAFALFRGQPVNFGRYIGRWTLVEAEYIAEQTGCALGNDRCRVRVLGVAKNSVQATT